MVVEIKVNRKVDFNQLRSAGFMPIKKGKLLISHRFNHLPLLHSCPGGVQQELVV